jgi:hypothetical protein
MRKWTEFNGSNDQLTKLGKDHLRRVMFYFLEQGSKFLAYHTKVFWGCLPSHLPTNLPQFYSARGFQPQQLSIHYYFNLSFSQLSSHSLGLEPKQLLAISTTTVLVTLSPGLLQMFFRLCQLSVQNPQGPMWHPCCFPTRVGLWMDVCVMHRTFFSFLPDS